MALYRTYRPASLDEVVGQEHVTVPLRRALQNDRVHHAYLFSGPRGCGKTSTARILARSLNCEAGPTADPCGVCQSCIDLAPNGPGSLDVIELDAASHGGVDDTRDLRERAMFAPASSRFKIYIIDEAHMVSTQGFNALLKLVEEPPPHVRFIFATTEPEKVIPTIRSRTHNYTFRLVSAKVLQQHLAHICEEENVPADPAALALVARVGAGSVRDSLSVLGQVISGSGPQGVTYEDALQQLGMTDATLLDETMDSLADHDGAALFTVIDRVIDAGHDPRRFVTDLLERIRDLIVLHNVPNASELGLIDAPEDRIAREQAQAKRFGLSELTRAATVISDALSELKGATAPRLHMELMVARLLLPASDADEAGMRARLDQLERRLGSAPVHPAAAVPAAEPVVAPTKPPKRPVESPPAPVADPAATAPAAEPAVAVETPARVAAKPPARPKPGAAKAADEPVLTPPAPGPSTNPGELPRLDQFVSLWPAVLGTLSSYSRVAWIGFDGSNPVSLSDGVLAVAVNNIGKINNIKSSAHDERLRQAIIDVMKADVKIDVVLGNGAPGPVSADAPAPVEVDAPSIDDPAADDATGVDLVLRELGGVQIGEIEH